MVTLLSYFILSMFFSVNDSILEFKAPFKVYTRTDTGITVLYLHGIEEYEGGNYYYPIFKIKEITVKRRKKSALLKIKLKGKGYPEVKNNKIIIMPPQKRFYIKLSKAFKGEIKKLLYAMGYKFDWLDSLREEEYTIEGNFTENTLKKRLLYQWKKEH